MKQCSEAEALARRTIARYGFDQINAAYRLIEPKERSARVAELLELLARLEAEIHRDPCQFGLQTTWESLGDVFERLGNTLHGREFTDIDVVMGPYARRRR